MKKYLITDPSHYSTDPSTFSAVLNRSLLKYKPDFVCFRDKSDGNKSELLNVFTKTLSGADIVSIVNGSVEVAKSYAAHGVHLRSDQQHLIKDAKDAKLLCVVSAHSTDEAQRAFESGCDFVTLSPVFDTPNKGEPLGFEAFVDMIKSLDAKRVFALGGIDDENKAKMIEASGVYGFASIRYFVR